MSQVTHDAIIGEPEVVEDTADMAHRSREFTAASTGELVDNPAWLRLKQAATTLRTHQVQDGSIPQASAHPECRTLVETITASILALAPLFPHDADYLEALRGDFDALGAGGFGVPDFLDSLVAFQPSHTRVDGLRHLVVFPMYTQNGSRDRFVEAVLVEVIWPEFVAELQDGDYSNSMFVPIRFLDFTPGYDTNAATLFPETIAMREIPSFTWGGSSPTARRPGSAGWCAPRPGSPASTCRRMRSACWTTRSSRSRPS